MNKYYHILPTIFCHLNDVVSESVNEKSCNITTFCNRDLNKIRTHVHNSFRFQINFIFINIFL